ncbi:GTPase Era [Candidatus Hepatincolaceae symbiont of Richtersius coronifer]
MENKKSSFVLVLGETNSGKSTLINQIVGAKISIVSHKVQTTRFKVLGVYTKDNCQIIFIDTPGIFTPSRDFDQAMVNLSYSQINEADKVIFLLDAQKGITLQTANILAKLDPNKENILVINKIDLVSKEALINLINYFKEYKQLNRFFMISALKNEGVNDLLTYLQNNLSHNVWYYEEDQLSDVPLYKLATEITREKIYKFLNQELPYNIVVEHQQWEETPNTIKIYQNIYVAKSNYKGMILGSKGSKIKEIRLAAMDEMKKNFNKKVSLFLYIKVDEKLFEKSYAYQDIGLEFFKNKK